MRRMVGVGWSSALTVPDRNIASRTALNSGMALTSVAIDHAVRTESSLPRPGSNGSGTER